MLFTLKLYKRIQARSTRRRGAVCTEAVRKNPSPFLPSAKCCLRRNCTKESKLFFSVGAALFTPKLLRRNPSSFHPSARCCLRRSCTKKSKLVPPVGEVLFMPKLYEEIQARSTYRRSTVYAETVRRNPSSFHLSAQHCLRRSCKKNQRSTPKLYERIKTFLLCRCGAVPVEPVRK